ncbi:D-alanine--D-alanine ligase [Parashewanella curva]|uniref:D-alanine--D-alanine ligase n=1 Tax=Parashewanella curva TaxID=2338552 RepID=A0A3L8PUK4_9GAMM|nr:D-alanine--D-alanine ligase [Parashewanella curva]RLV58984.1 D-alanine--D-alanine ligase [Parashewanella curva]
MSSINVVLLCGGGSDEHDISLISAGYIQSCLSTQESINLVRVELTRSGQYLGEDAKRYNLSQDGYLVEYGNTQSNFKIDFVIPCFHGFPGETGDIQSMLTLSNLPFLGSDSEASIQCFNKITAKQWFSALGIPNTSYLFLSENTSQSVEQVKSALKKWGSVFIKAASQGSSVGCYQVDNINNVESTVAKAFEYSPFVLVEKTINARELEVAVYEYNNEIIATLPGEIITDSEHFYDFNEKYAENSKAKTEIAAKIPNEVAELIRQYAIKAFEGMKLRHLARIDFFLSDKNEILLNEINTFPGMTPISMFPKMLQNHGEDFGEFLVGIIEKETARQ